MAACPPRPPLPLWVKEPEPVHLARWIKMALAILRLYCQTENPTTEMKFQNQNGWCKKSSPYTKVSKTVFDRMWGWLQYCPWIHCHQQLLWSPRKCIAVSSFWSWSKCTRKGCTSDFRSPIILEWKPWIATIPVAIQEYYHYDYYDWKTFPKSDYASPPLLKHFTNQQLLDHAQGRVALRLPDIPNHSQAIERWYCKSCINPNRPQETTCCLIEQMQEKLFSPIVPICTAYWY